MPPMPAPRGGGEAPLDPAIMAIIMEVLGGGGGMPQGAPAPPMPQGPQGPPMPPIAQMGQMAPPPMSSPTRPEAMPMSAGPGIQDIMGGAQFNPMPGGGMPGAMDQFPGQGPGIEGLPPDMLQAVLTLLQQVFAPGPAQAGGGMPPGMMPMPPVGGGY